MQEWLEQLDLMPTLEMSLRLLAATLVGGIIGWEREKQDKPAGLRTHMMVSLGAAAFMVATLNLAESINNERGVIQIDPSRALAGIIGGIGFLGAGSIIQSRGSVRGITTAAGIWVSAAIGTCCGLGQYSLAIVSGLLSVAILLFVGRFEHHVMETKDSDPLEEDS